jgi:GMP synthase-like glutamine amidotransferase
MNKKVLIIKNIFHEDPGILSIILDERNIKYDIIDLSKNVSLPKISNYRLIIILGGPDSVNDFTDKIIKEKAFVKLALIRKVPILGICLGIQLLADVYGAEVYKNPIEEIGFKHNNLWYTIKLTEEGLKDPVFEGINDNFIVFQLHGETFHLADNLTLLGTGQFCRNQVIRIGENNYGFQFHFEVTEDLLKIWLEKAPELVNTKPYEILEDFEIVKDDFLKRGRKIFTNYLKLIQII